MQANGFNQRSAIAPQDRRAGRHHSRGTNMTRRVNELYLVYALALGLVAILVFFAWRRR